MFSPATEKWIQEVARKNNCSRKKVIRYCSELSAKKVVLSHLDLCGRKVLSHHGKK